MLNTLMAQVDWPSLIVGLLIGWNMLKQPKWVCELGSWIWDKVQFWK
jgi:hypothetical protein